MERLKTTLTVQAVRKAFQWLTVMLVILVALQLIATFGVYSDYLTSPELRNIFEKLRERPLVVPVTAILSFNCLCLALVAEKFQAKLDAYEERVKELESK